MCNVTGDVVRGEERDTLSVTHTPRRFNDLLRNSLFSHVAYLSGKCRGWTVCLWLVMGEVCSIFYSASPDAHTRGRPIGGGGGGT